MKSHKNKSSSIGSYSMVPASQCQVWLMNWRSASCHLKINVRPWNFCNLMGSRVVSITISFRIWLIWIRRGLITRKIMPKSKTSKSIKKTWRFRPIIKFQAWSKTQRHRKTVHTTYCQNLYFSVSLDWKTLRRRHLWVNNHWFCHRLTNYIITIILSLPCNSLFLRRTVTLNSVSQVVHSRCDVLENYRQMYLIRGLVYLKIVMIYQKNSTSPVSMVKWPMRPRLAWKVLRSMAVLGDQYTRNFLQVPDAKIEWTYL